MTELEKKAKEYRKLKKQEIIDNDDFEKLDRFDENVEEAYIAGAKENGVEWHKVADKPLPKETKNKIVVQTVNGNTTMVFFYANAWREIVSCREMTGIYAWCEIPQFKEQAE